MDCLEGVLSFLAQHERFNLAQMASCKKTITGDRLKY